jgi:sulfide dehydrogenase cytochrome subunit
MPSISGLNFRYFYQAMQNFKKERRKSTVMGRIAKGYKTSQLQSMALHFGTRPWTGRQDADLDLELAKRGQSLHQEYCEECHARNGHFQDKETPPLAGQAKGYLLFQLTDYRKADTVMPQPPLMQERLEKLSDADLEALSAFYASSLTAEGPPRVAHEMESEKE